MKSILVAIATSAFVLSAFSQDSVTLAIHPSYDTKARMHRWFFGENYRREWATPVTLPLVRISAFQGGLTPIRLGGGMQSKSLRLVDKQGREWVIRSVEKNPESVIPEELRRTFARDWVDDATSAQHPFGALVVPPIANAVKVPHSRPFIGVIAEDAALGEHKDAFAGMVALIEEREPLGDSDNSEKMKEKLAEDNDNRLDGRAMLRARLLDMLVGDWDRHEDQWRWFDQQPGKSKYYLPVPRDRDQVFHVTEGLFPKIAAREYLLPTLRDFDADLKRPEWILYKSSFVNADPSFQLSKEEWLEVTREFQLAVTDSVLELALQQLPQPIYELRHTQLFQKLKQRREKLPQAISRYYDFIHKIVDLRLSDKNELIELSDNLRVRVSKINKSGEITHVLIDKKFDPSLTRELRVYTGLGADSLVDNRSAKSIRVRYMRDTVFTPVNLYNTTMPLLFAGLNIDDGLILGAGFKYTRQEGFRKYPYASMHQLVGAHSFSTAAYRIKYNSEWTKLVGKADLLLQVFLHAPNNTINFFGRGNETSFEKTEGFKRYHRTRFSTYQVDPALRWSLQKSTFQAGPSLYYYAFDAKDNEGRFINNTAAIGSYDSASLDRNKLHLGAALQYTYDGRNRKLLPYRGLHLQLRTQAFKGVVDYANDFFQLVSELAVYQRLNAAGTFVLADRIGGTLSVGRPGFYQSAFLGGHENLLGYRQYRFAGQHSFYNNLELRAKLADLANYLLPGQFGVTAFWDAGRVWQRHDNSGKIHHGVGGGIYFAPATLFVFNFVLGYSEEDLLPYFTMGLRF